MITRPQLGVMPERIWKQKRMLELARAIYEYMLYGPLDNVSEWIDELHRLDKEL